MLGIIPSTSKTFIVEGMFGDKPFEEGKLYVDPESKRVYMYSTAEKRSNPKTGYFPVWDGSKAYISKFSNEKYLDKDVTKTDIVAMGSSIDKNVAGNILYQQRRSENDDILQPQLIDGDNMFTQCIKGVLNNKKLTIVDLVDMSSPKLSEKVISNYYSALTKITFMRLDKWNIWINTILHLRYSVIVYKDDKKLLTYNYPKDVFDTGIVKYDNITKTKDDPFKKIIKILMIMENINKNSLRSKEVDDYTINNMLTTLNSNKALSAQLFSRFIRMANLSYDVVIFDKDDLLFEYHE
jgi:type VI protein secretion system component Hcp